LLIFNTDTNTALSGTLDVAYSSPGWASTTSFLQTNLTLLSDQNAWISDASFTFQGASATWSKNGFGQQIATTFLNWQFKQSNTSSSTFGFAWLKSYISASTLGTKSGILTRNTYEAVGNYSKYYLNSMEMLSYDSENSQSAENTVYNLNTTDSLTEFIRMVQIPE
jgi:hypothetical protein